VTTVILFILVLSILVFVHELGHFLFAKKAGILVYEFAIGFGPKVFSFMKGETLYSLRLFPLGGFVRMAGEDGQDFNFKKGSLIYYTISYGKVDNIYLYKPKTISKELKEGVFLSADLEKEFFLELESKEKLAVKHDALIHLNTKTVFKVAPVERKYFAKTLLQRAEVVFAGPFFNILLTMLLFFVYALFTGIDAKLTVEDVFHNKPAYKAGLKKGDVILEVNGKKVTNVDKFRYELMESKGKSISLLVKRGKRNIVFHVTPKKQGEIYQIGISFDESKLKQRATILMALKEGFTKTFEWSVFILDSFYKLFTNQIPLSSLGGPLQIGSITGKVYQSGFAPLIRWTALLSLNLGIFNLLPIPALDGSRLFFLGIEAIFGKPVRREGIIHFIGFALLMFLMVLVTFNDIRKIFHINF